MGHNYSKLFIKQLLFLSSALLYCILLSTTLKAQSAQENNSIRSQKIAIPIAPNSTELKLNIYNSKDSLYKDKFMVISKEEKENYDKYLKNVIDSLGSINTLQKTNLMNKINELLINDNKNKQKNESLKAYIDSVSMHNKNKIEELIQKYDSVSRNKNYLFNQYYNSIKQRNKSEFEKLKIDINSKRNELEARKIKLSFWLEHADNQLEKNQIFIRDSAFAVLYLENQDILNNLNEVDKEYEGMKKVKENADSQKISVDSLKGLLDRYENSIQNKIEIINILNNRLNGKIDLINNIIKSKNIKNNNELDAIPNINSFLGQNFITPNISLKGATKFNKDKLAGEVRVFTAAANNNKLPKGTLFVPESSPYGISLTMNYAITKEIGIKIREKKAIKNHKWVDSLYENLLSKTKLIDSLVVISRKASNIYLYKIEKIKYEKELIERKLNKRNFFNLKNKFKNECFLNINANYLGKNFSALELEKWVVF